MEESEDSLGGKGSETEDGVDSKPGESCWHSSEDKGNKNKDKCAPEQESRLERGQGDPATQRVVGYDYKPVVEGEAEDFLCYICHLIARKPTKVECCGNIFCEACITTQTECPLCRMENFRSIIDKLAERKMNEMRVFCPNYEKGCKWCGEIRSVEQHLQEPALTDEEPDAIERCQYQHTKCKKCDQAVLYVHLRQHKESECDHKVVACEYNFVGCQFKDSKIRMKKHTQESMQEHLDLLRKFTQKENASIKSYLFKIILVASIVCCIIASIILCCITITSTYLSQCNTKEFEARIDKMDALCNKELEARIDKMDAQCNTKKLATTVEMLKRKIDKLEAEQNSGFLW